MDKVENIVEIDFKAGGNHPRRPPLRARPLSDTPVVVPTPLWALELAHPPVGTHFRRDHHPVPDPGWLTSGLEVCGAVRRPIRLSTEDLLALPQRQVDAVLECAGHRRSELEPPPPGVRWGLGAAAEARWAGPSLASVLELAGVAGEAVEVVLEGADRGPFPGRDGTHCFGRALPLEKALHPDTLLALRMDGEPLPGERGGPLRAIVPGWYATDSVKWLARIEVIDRPFAGPWQRLDYRMIHPGTTPEGERMTELPVHAIATSPTEGEVLDPHRSTRVRGVAWGGRGGIASVEVSIDGGRFEAARLTPPRGPWSRTFWRLERRLDPGEHSVAVRATDGSGRGQPERPLWNARGFANHSVHRVAFRVTTPLRRPPAASARGVPLRSTPPPPAPPR